MGLVSIKEDYLVSRKSHKFHVYEMNSIFLGVVKKNDAFIFNMFRFCSQVSSQHRFEHFSFQDSQEPPPPVSISSQPQAKVII